MKCNRQQGVVWPRYRAKTGPQIQGLRFSACLSMTGPQEESRKCRDSLCSTHHLKIKMKDDPGDLEAQGVVGIGKEIADKCLRLRGGAEPYQEMLGTANLRELNCPSWKLTGQGAVPEVHLPLQVTVGLHWPGSQQASVAVAQRLELSSTTNVVSRPGQWWYKP